MERLSRWGVGPKIGAASLSFALLAGLATYFWPNVCLIRPMPQILTGIGWVLLVVGFVMWGLAARAIMTAYNHDELVTTGVAALVRNPIYSAVIVLIMPGVALLSTSWPVMMTPLVAYIAFKCLIHAEEEYLARRFGQTYLDYRRRVNELIPIPRFH
jgi:protein-S-isoprenylcysteine O-methyltransferase Ste14